MLKLATVFSGIGAVEQALKQMDIKYKIVFAADNGERYLKQNKDEIDKLIEELNYKEKQKTIEKLYDTTKKRNYVYDSYITNYKNEVNEGFFYQDVRFIDGNRYNGDVDLFVGGSPCQSFSIMGKRGGLEDTRGTLFYDYARLVKEIQPKVFIYENVEGLLTHDRGKTWDTIKNVFDDLGYNWQMKVLNSMDYGIPQNRKRVFVVGTKEMVNFKFPNPIKLEKTLKDFLEKKVPVRHYLGKKGFQFVTNKKYKNRARVNSNITSCQKANQQFNWNGDFVFEELNPIIHTEEILQRAYVGDLYGKKGVIRQLSHRECLRLMGFSDDFKIVVPNIQAYRQSGNSIVVNVLKSILMELEKVLVYEKN